MRKHLFASAALAACTALAPAAAHDTWFAPQGSALLALGTGNQFPRFEFTIALQQLLGRGCVDAQGGALPLAHVADQSTALLLRAPPAAVNCWARVMPFEVEIDNPVVDVYFKEINALPAVREHWAALRARGVRWHETYVKNARVEIGAGSSAPAPGLNLDIVLEAGPRPLRAGDTLRAQLLRDGQPLAGQPVELRSDLSPIGLWRQTDAEGRFEVPLPLAARWVLRSVELRPAADNPDRWESRFVTVAFEVLARR